MYTSVLTSIYLYIYVSMYTSVLTSLYLYIYISIYLYIYISIYLRILVTSSHTGHACDSPPGPRTTPGPHTSSRAYGPLA
jgi:hypothetical protein